MLSLEAGLCSAKKQTRKKEVYVGTGITYFIGLLSVSLRITGKLMTKRLAADDCIAIAAVLLTTIPVGCITAMTVAGFGSHVWDLTPEQGPEIMRLFYIAQVTYPAVLALIKITLVLFYLQIFRQRRFIIAAYTLLGFIIVSSLVLCLTLVFACHPIDDFWNLHAGARGTCLVIPQPSLATSAVLLSHDVLLFILPVMFVKNLQMKNQKKIGVSLIFLVGSLGCVFTALRVRCLYKLQTSWDPAWEYVPPLLWTELEISALFICTSLPSIRIVVVRLLGAKWKKLSSWVSQTASWKQKGLSTSQSDQVHLPDRSKDSEKWNDKSIMGMDTQMIEDEEYLEGKVVTVIV